MLKNYPRPKNPVICKCQHCKMQTCPGNNDISNCPQPCVVPCKQGGKTSGYQEMDMGYVPLRMVAEGSSEFPV